MKGLLMIVAVVVVLAVGAVAVGGAATSAQEGDGPLGTFLGRVAEKLGISRKSLWERRQRLNIPRKKTRKRGPRR